MADTKDVILNIKTNFAENIDQLAKLQKELDDLKVAELQLNAAVKAGTKTREDADKELEALAAQVRNVKNEQREYRKEIDNEIKKQQEAEGSIKQMRASLANLRKEYEELSKAERDGAKGNELLTKIQSTTDELKKLEAAQGDYRREVGHYQNAINNLSPVLSKALGEFANLSKGTMNVGVAFKNGVSAVKSFGTQLLKLLANPIVAIIAAIAAVVMKLVDSFKKNDAAMTELQSAFAAFKPILDLVEKGFQALVGVATKVVSVIGNVAKTITSWIPSLRDYGQAEEDIVRSTDALEDSERKYTIASAEREAQISELRAKSAEKDKYTFEQRKQFLEEAIKLEEEELKDKKKIATEKLRIAEKEAALEIGYTELTEEAYEKLTDEQKDKITELRKAVIDADREFSDGTRRLRGQMSNFNSTEEAERKQRAQAAQQAAKERRQNEKQAMTELQDMYFQTLYSAGEKAYSIAKANGEREIQALKDRLANEKNLTVAAKEAINKQIILKEADLQLQLGEIQRTTFENLGKSWGETEKQIDELRLQFEKDPDAIFDIKIAINEAETNELKRVAHKQVEDLEKAKKMAEKDLMTLDDNDIMVKYGGVFELYKIESDSVKTNMEILINFYKDSLDDAEKAYKKYSDTLDEATKAENQRIKDDKTRAIHDQQKVEIDLARKHAEILRAIELESNYDTYSQNEIEKTRILREQAEERLQIAREEYSRISGERDKYTDDEIKAIYGSLEAYDNAVLEANLKVIESENDVKDAIKDVANASAQQKITMIENATAIMGSVNSILGSMQSLFETMAEDNESYADFATAMALMQILVSTAISIANAIEGATAAGAATGAAAPFTTPVFITEMVAIVAGALASATTTLLKAQQAKKSAPKFADGGLIGGHYASSESEGRRDDVAIQASKGEYIINANAVKRYGVGFLDSINGTSGSVSITKFANGGYVSDATVMAGNYQFQMDMTRQMMVEAMSEIQPIVSVREITHAQNRVAMAERISKK